MSAALIEVAPNRIPENVFKLIGQEWMLVTAGKLSSFNTMTANWGGLGYLWNRNVCFAFVRPQRHTFSFMEQADHFTLSFFDETERKALEYCGSHSGRDVDKIAATGLMPLATATGAVYFAQARLVFECRKIYVGDILAGGFLEPAIRAEFYAQSDFHRMYIGEIIHCLAR